MLRQAVNVAVVVLALAAGITSQKMAHGSNRLRTVAMSGDRAPGTSEGMTFSRFHLGPPALNDSGHTAFGGRLDINTALNNSGIWTEGGNGQLRLAALAGSPAPGTTQNFPSFGSPESSPIINDIGQTAFAIPAFGRGGALGVWSDSSGTLTSEALPGQHAPDTMAGINFSDFITGSAGLLFNNQGHVGFQASLTGSGVTLSNDNGLWVGGAAAPLSLRAREGAVAAGTGANFASLGSGIMNDLGQIAYVASLVGSGIDNTNDFGYWSERSGSPELIAREGSPTPGMSAGVVFQSLLFNPAQNNAGHIGLTGVIAGPGINSSNDTGVWADRGNGFELVIREGAPAPGTTVNFAGLFEERVINAKGQLAFVGHLTGPDITSSNEAGIWSEGGGEGLKLVAREGEPAPGTSAVFGSITLANSPVLNRLGQTAFLAPLAGPGVNSSNDVGIWAQDVTGILHLIAREGDTLDVSDDPLSPNLKTVNGLSFAGRSGNEDGRHSGFNEFGQVAFWARFTDGSEGVFVSSLAAVPEPSIGVNFAALMVTGAAFRSRRRYLIRWMQ